MRHGFRTSADLHGQRYRSRHNAHGIWFHGEVVHRSHNIIGCTLPQQLLKGKGELRCCIERILPALHRSCAGVVCLTGKHNVLPIDTGDAADRCRVQSFFLQPTALLDVALQKCPNLLRLNPDIVRLSDISADLLHTAL